MANIKLVNTKGEWTWSPADSSYNDLSKLKEKLTDPFSQIKNIRIKTIAVNWDGVRMRGLQFYYQITTNDDKIIDIEGNNTFEGTVGSNWDYINIPTDDYLVKVKGGAGGYVDWIQFIFDKQAPSKVFGNPSGGNPFEIEQPILYLCKTAKDWSSRQIAFYTWSPSYKEVDKTQAELTKYKEQAGGKTAEELKTELANLNKRPNITQADYDQLLNGKNQLNQILPGLFDSNGKLDEKKLTELKNLQNNQEKHPNLPDNWEAQITQAKEWANTFAGKSAEEVKNELDELNFEKDNLQAQLDALQEGDGSTRALFEVPPKS